MSITDSQKQKAEEQQWIAARAGGKPIRLVAGPGTGKSRTIEKRVHQLLADKVAPDQVCVISFTRATCAELRDRITNFCKGKTTEEPSGDVVVSTMHALALRILKKANLLLQYPS